MIFDNKCYLNCNYDMKFLYLYILEKEVEVYYFFCMFFLKYFGERIFWNMKIV